MTTETLRADEFARMRLSSLTFNTQKQQMLLLKQYQQHTQNAGGLPSVAIGVTSVSQFEYPRSQAVLATVYSNINNSTSSGVGASPQQQQQQEQQLFSVAPPALPPWSVSFDLVPAPAAAELQEVFASANAFTPASRTTNNSNNNNSSTAAGSRANGGSNSASANGSTRSGSGTNTGGPSSNSNSNSANDVVRYTVHGTPLLPQAISTSTTASDAHNSNSSATAASEIAPLSLPLLLQCPSLCPARALAAWAVPATAVAAAAAWALARRRRDRLGLRRARPPQSQAEGTYPTGTYPAGTQAVGASTTGTPRRRRQVVTPVSQVQSLPPPPLPRARDSDFDTNNNSGVHGQAQSLSMTTPRASFSLERRPSLSVGSTGGTLRRRHRLRGGGALLTVTACGEAGARRVPACQVINMALFGARRNPLHVKGTYRDGNKNSAHGNVIIKSSSSSVDQLETSASFASKSSELHVSNDGDRDSSDSDSETAGANVSSATVSARQCLLVPCAVRVTLRTYPATLTLVPTPSNAATTPGTATATTAAAAASDGSSSASATDADARQIDGEKPALTTVMRRSSLAYPNSQFSPQNAFYHSNINSATNTTSESGKSNANAVVAVPPQSQSQFHQTQTEVELVIPVTLTVSGVSIKLPPSCDRVFWTPSSIGGANAKSSMNNAANRHGALSCGDDVLCSGRDLAVEDLFTTLNTNNKKKHNKQFNLITHKPDATSVSANAYGGTVCSKCSCKKS